jgi:hypothetical protein
MRLRYRFIKLELAGLAQREDARKGYLRAKASLFARRKNSWLEARRFSPVMPEGAPQYSRDGIRFIVAVAPADQDRLSAGQILSCVASLHPAVQRLCAYILDGATLAEAAADAKLDVRHLAAVQPALKQFLSERLGLRNAAAAP